MSGPPRGGKVLVRLGEALAEEQESQVMARHALAAFLAFITAVALGAEAPSENLALGRKYTLKPAPTYSYCTDPGDATQLTDGVRTQGYFWTQKSTVGWTGCAPKFITIDLGAVAPIRGVTFGTAAGVAGVEWPAELLVFVSDDAQRWFEAGDLVALSARTLPPPLGKYATHVFRADDLATHGRFVQLVARPSGVFVFCDEIEVLRGDPALLAKPHQGAGADNVEALIATRTFNGFIQAQLRRDLEAVRQDLAPGGLTDADKARLSQRAEELAKQIQAMPVVSPQGFRAIVPMTDLERAIFRLQAEVWRAQGKPALRLWKSHRWDPLAPSDEPPEGKSAPEPVLDVRMMNNEYRADVLNLTHAAPGDALVRCRIENLPGGTNPGYVTVHEVLCVGTRHFIAVSAALPLAKREGDDYLLTVPSGMTRQLWLGFHPKDLPAGPHEGRLRLDDGSGQPRFVPVRLRIYPLRFPDTTTLCVGGWDYTNADQMYGVTPQNRDLLIAYLREHYVNAPWATNAVLPVGEFDPAGEMAAKPDSRPFDQWVARWPGAKRYCVFCAFGDAGGARAVFAGSEAGTPPFERKVGQWIRFWAQHARELGLQPKQLALLLVDEPHQKEHYDVTAAFARVIRQAAPEVTLWVDPQPTEDKTCLEAFALMDVLCPLRSQWLDQGEWAKSLFLAQQKEGRELWFYSANGPARNFDPFAYYLLQPWHAFQVGAKGSCYWAFGDWGDGHTWNEFLETGNGPYCPFYLEPDRITTAKYMEAVREGVQDYEYLVMLRDRIAALERAGTAGDLLARAKALLASAADRVMKEQPRSNYRWDEPKDRTVADAVRVEVLEILTALQGR